MYNIGSHLSGVGRDGWHGVFGSQIWVATLKIKEAVFCTYHVRTIQYPVLLILSGDKEE